jgi:superfamily II RNA helicase
MTSYVDIENKDIKLENPAKEFPYELDDFQNQAIIAIENGQNVLVAAHTGAGKSTVADYAIALANKNGKRAIYISPIKALSNQQFNSFSKNYYTGLFTGDHKINPDGTCIVATTEIIRNMLFTDNSFLDNVSTVIIDEVHFINDRDRGHVWEELIIMLKKEIQLVMLSATIDKAKEFSSWIGKIKDKPTRLIFTDHRPIPLKHYIYYENKKYLILDEKKNFNHDNFTKIDKEYSKIRYNYKTQLNPFLKYLKEEDLFPALFFVFSKKNCKNYAKIIMENLIDHETRSKIENIFEKYMNGIFKEFKYLPIVTEIKPLLLKGIGVHHAGLPPALKEIQEILFEEGLIKVLFATETFKVGVNMPTRTVIFTEFYKYDGYINNMRILKPNEYTQMSGRSGRRGIDNKGIIIYAPFREIPYKGLIIDMMTGKSDSIKSKLKLDTQFVLKVINSEKYNIGDFVKLSLLGKEENSDKECLEFTINELQEKLKIAQKSMDNISNLDKLDEYFLIKGQMNNARQNKKKKLQRKLNSLIEGDKKFNKDLETIKKLEDLKEKIKNKKKDLSYNYLNENIKITILFLIKINYIKSDVNDNLNLNRNNLTIKGIIASEINECDEILLTEILYEGILNELNVYEICGVLSIFNKPEKDEYIDDEFLEDEKYKKIIKTINKIKKIKNYIEDSGIEFNTSYIQKLSMSFIKSSYMWAEGENFIDTYKAWYIDEEKKYEGNFIKNIIKIYNICNELIKVCEIHQNTQLLEKMKIITENGFLLKSIVTFESIYLQQTY